MKFFNFVLVISCLYSLSAVAEHGQNFGYYRSPNPRVRIIGGKEVEPHAYPYQVLIRKGDLLNCGAALISPNYVLTAAHCVTEMGEKMTVNLGAHYISSYENTPVPIGISNIVIHENYNSTSLQNDIALIKLPNPAPLHKTINTIGLPSRSDSAKDYLGIEATSTGWGLMEDNSYQRPNALRAVNLTVIDLGECKYYNENDYSITFVSENNLCTSGYKNKGTCQGDSGGPLVYLGKLIGIVSFGSMLCETCEPSVFTRVDKFLDWIEEHSDVVVSQSEELNFTATGQIVYRSGMPTKLLFSVNLTIFS